jgi:hypothetical protein
MASTADPSFMCQKDAGGEMPTRVSPDRVRSRGRPHASRVLLLVGYQPDLLFQLEEISSEITANVYGTTHLHIADDDFFL